MKHKLPAAGSSYSPHDIGEDARVEEQANIHKAFDLRLLKAGLKAMDTDNIIGVDLGCSMGHVTTDRFHEIGVTNYIGFDKDFKAIKKARQRNSSAKFEQINLEEKSFETELLKLEKPALFFSAMTFHHLADPVRVLRTILNKAPKGSVLVIRSLDDGSKIDYHPNGLTILPKILELSQRAPGKTDRYHGRKLSSQLFRAGFRETELMTYTISTLNMSRAERHALFSAHFSHRAASWQWERGSDLRASKEARDDMSLMVDYLSEYELDIEDPAYFLLDMLFGSISKVIG